LIALGHPAAVHEDQGRPVRANQLEQLRMNRRPDRGVLGVLTLRTSSTQGLHVLDRHLDAERQGLLLSSVDDGDGTVVDGASMRLELGVYLSGRWPVVGGRLLPNPGLRPLSSDLCPAEESRDLIERSLCGREADSLGRLRAQGPEPLDRQHQVGAALGGDEGVNLVDDDRLDRPQCLACVRGQK
jgi:hypothetical protein